MGAARLQRALVALLATVAVLWVGTALAHGRPGLALLGVLVPMFGHGAVLGAEFVLLPLLHGDDPAPRATPAELLRAWSRETWTALVVFGWRQPFRHDAVPDHLPDDARGRRGVVLVHGFLCNRGLWNPWLERLRAAGVPCVAVTLDPVFGPIEAYAPTVDAAVQRLLDLTGVPPLVVAHSMGGLAVREWLAQSRRVRDVHAVVTIGTPHHGTWLARFAFSANARQMRWHGEWLAALAQREPPAGERPPFVCFYGHCDNIVFPPSTAVLPGAAAHHVRATGHVDMALDDAVFAEVQRQLALPPR
ncbi:esterase/lipase family protein [Azohydromonas sediminis]|uniref:esterase/lipase family protein n=1 Tax=Azohydromonas sediminis TaxID=2259674 RepID=UPI000E65CA4C|nr:alpha/beta fold hydrolase [Azohydromonas sediminis]